jgi:Flp pilus assembly protein CpaB
MRARHSISESAGRFIMPGDYVDVVLTANIRSAVDASKQPHPLRFPGWRHHLNYTSEVVLEHEVLAIDQSMSEHGRTGPGQVGRTAALEVTPNDAGRLLIASNGSVDPDLAQPCRNCRPRRHWLRRRTHSISPPYIEQSHSCGDHNYMSKADQPVMPKPKVEEPVAPPPPQPVVESTGGSVRVNRGGNIQEQGIGQ